MDMQDINNPDFFLIDLFGDQLPLALEGEDPHEVRTLLENIMTFEQKTCTIPLL